jgi:hypothetical protein
MQLMLQAVEANAHPANMWALRAPTDIGKHLARTEEQMG